MGVLLIATLMVIDPKEPVVLADMNIDTIFEKILLLCVPLKPHPVPTSFYRFPTLLSVASVWPRFLFFDPEGPLQVQIINFNFKTVQVTWNSSGSPGVNLTFSYSFRPNEGDSSCPEYILEDGRTVGCVLQAEGDGILSFSIRRGTRPLLAKSQWISSYLKPDPPGDLTFRWHEEAVTVTCSELPHKSLLYEIQYKSTFDPEWQAEEGRSCNVSIPGLDPDKCYFFRARARTMEAAYGPDTYPSDWSEVAHQQRGRRRDSCQEQRLFPRFVLISGAVAFLTVVLLLVSLWKLRRSRFKNLILSNSVCEPFLLQFHPGRSHLDFNLPAPGPLGAVTGARRCACAGRWAPSLSPGMRFPWQRRSDGRRMMDGWTDHAGPRAPSATRPVRSHLLQRLSLKTPTRP
ncbi:cytokine receptor-like factor 2 isoform X2 [Equus caballus]|uniref:cytokine receptor-like factor 2 isoform X2 n=1 Tax=Equus caballus TaxID=9796 RepID=UPI0038B2B7F5